MNKKSKASNLPEKKKVDVQEKVTAGLLQLATLRTNSKKQGERTARERMHPRYEDWARNYLKDPLRSGRVFRVRQIDLDLAAISSAAGGVGYAKNLQLDELSQFADFAAIFDQYRFVECKARFLPRTNTHNLTVQSAVTTTTMSPLLVAWDPDDSTVPTNIANVLGYPNLRVEPGYKEFSISFKPRCAIAAYGGAFTQFGDFDGWLDCASDDTEWYAIKAWQAGAGVSQTTFPIWDVVYEIHVEFRFVH